MKCLERIIKRILTDEVSDTLDPMQFAYRSSRGVEDALLTINDQITSHLDKGSGNYARILYVDFSSAFNAMNTRTLLEKLQMLGINYFIIQWFRNFLNKRPQRVRQEKQFSSKRMLSNGCPQGCVSSPLLYIIYTNDCQAKQPNCIIVKYADDTAILGLMNVFDDTLDKYFNEIEKFMEWCQNNKLELNVSKTKEQIFDFARQNRITHCNSTINDQKVDIVSTFKYLGIKIDNCLTYKSHVEYVSKKVGQRLHVLRKLRSFNISQKTMKQMYSSLILSIISFGMTMWYGNCGVKEKSKLQSLINIAGKIVNFKFESAASFHNKNVIKKAHSIMDQPSHPLCEQFELLPSGRRYAGIKTKTNRYKSTFIPTAIRAINEKV